jgi:hypothetical protein
VRVSIARTIDAGPLRGVTLSVSRRRRLREALLRPLRPRLRDRRLGRVAIPPARIA